MKYKYKVIRVDIGETSDERQDASELLSKGGELGWRIIHVAHDVLNAKIVWMEKASEQEEEIDSEDVKEYGDDKKVLSEVPEDSPGPGDGGSGEKVGGGEGSQGS